MIDFLDDLRQRLHSLGKTKDGTPIRLDLTYTAYPVVYWKADYTSPYSTYITTLVAPSLTELRELVKHTAEGDAAHYGCTLGNWSDDTEPVVYYPTEKGTS